MRRAYEDAIGRLAEIGIAGAGRFFDWTPREIEWEVRAFARARAEDAEKLSALAWLFGKYVALGVNAPGRYPSAPPKPRVSRGTMTAAEMKRALLRAVGRGERHDAGDA